MSECTVCRRGWKQGVSVFRNNPKGEKAIWRCEEHLDKEYLDPETVKIVHAIEGSK